MIKKIAALAGAGVLMLASTGVVFGFGGRGVRTTLTSEANTGMNVQGNYMDAGDDIRNWGEGETEVGGDNTMRTGDATARTRARVWNNSDCGCRGKTTTTLSSSANTGLNVQGNSMTAGDDIKGGATVKGDNSMTTGNATATSKAFVVVGGSWHWVD